MTTDLRLGAFLLLLAAVTASMLVGPRVALPILLFVLVMTAVAYAAFAS